MKALLKLTSLAALTMLLGLSVSGVAAAAGGGSYPLRDIETSTSNVDSLRRGAQTYVNYCLGCHSLKYVRYSSLIDGLQVDKETIEKALLFTGSSVNGYMTTVMPEERSRKWLGITPPDLSLKVSEKGPAWVYTFLTTFYADPDSKTGASNALWGGGDPSKAQLSMPFVLWELQGWQRPILKEVETHRMEKQTNEKGETVEVEVTDTKTVIHGFSEPVGGRLSPAEFDERMKDLTNFMAYAAEPGRGNRHEIGAWVLIFLLVFIIVAYLLKKEYWKDVQ